MESFSTYQEKNSCSQHSESGGMPHRLKCSLVFLRLAASLRYSARRKGIEGIACPWVSLAPKALATPTAKLLSPLTRLTLLNSYISNL